jgi:hypothetical protein
MAERAPAGERHLLIMASYFDHATGTVPRPTIVHDKNGVNDPHDNAAIAIDDDGFVWVFVSGRARIRPGFIYKSKQPYSVDEFERILEGEMTYPQPKYISGRGFSISSRSTRRGGSCIGRRARMGASGARRKAGGV